MSYQVPEHIDKEKVFLVNRSEIGGRLDPKIVLYNKKIKHSAHKRVKFKALLLEKPQYGANEPSIIRKSYNEPRYIRITDIDSDGLIKVDELGATASIVEDRFFLNENDLLFARSGATAGKTYIHKKTPYSCFYAGYLIRFVVNPTIAMPYYIFVYTQSMAYKEWVKAIQRPSAQPNINAEEYQSLEIPLPDFNTQEIIVRKINLAYQKKKDLECKAKQLIDSIDFYLLDKLEIKLPAISNAINNRVFKASFKEIAGGRMDPVKVLYLGDKAKSENFPNVQLRSIASIVKGQAITSDEIIDGPFPVIAGGQTSPYSHNVSNHTGNVITVSASGAYSGYVWYHDKPIFASDCSVIKSYDENKFRTKYIFEVLKAQQKHIYLLQQGAGQPHVYPSDLGELWIPEIDIQQQDEIITEIQAIRDNAASLRKEAEEGLEKAKKEVEKQIIGK